MMKRSRISLYANKIKIAKNLSLILLIGSNLSLLSANEIKNETTRLNEIKVSANKIEENIQDIPQSIIVITKEDIDQKGIKDLGDVIKQVPNMARGDAVENNASFRGLTHSHFTNNNPIVVYIDGVPYYDRHDFNPSLANAWQIEVLKGPQGTLYGKDAIGGVINIITKPPQNKWNGEVGVEYGNNNSFNTTFNTSGAIIDNKLFAGINNSYYHTDGWITNNHLNMPKKANRKNDRKTSGFLLYKPTDELQARLTITNNFEKRNWMNVTNSTDTSKPINDFKRKDGKNVDFDVPTFQKNEINSQALNLSYETQKVRLSSTTVHKKANLITDHDTDYTSGNSADGLNQFAYTTINTYSQELKLSSKNQDIKYVTGLFFDKENREQGPYGQNIFYSGIYKANANSDTNSKTQAIFGQTMIPFLQNFELTLGGRYQRISKDTNIDVLHTLNGSTINSFSYIDKKTFNAFLPKVAVSYKINDNLTTYTSISKGYMPGGFNYFPSTNVSKDNTYLSQKAINYEIGAKYIGENFALNTSIFRMDIKDAHVYKVVGTDFVTDNAKKAHSQGIELDGTYFISDNLSILGALGLIEAKYDDYDSGTGNFKGQRIQDTPRYSANLGISYLPNKGVYARFDLTGTGKTNFMNVATNSMQEANGGITMDAKIGYRLKNWDIYSFITNITNEEYATYYITKTNLATVGFNEPRKFGAGLRYKF